MQSRRRRLLLDASIDADLSLVSPIHLSLHISITFASDRRGSEPCLR
jgi:hypothetical protein